MRVVGQKWLAGCGVGAADDPVVAAEAFANFALRFFEVAFDGGPEGGRQIRKGFGRGGGAGVVLESFRFQDIVGGHVVVIIIVFVGIDAGGLRAVVGDVGI